MKDVPAHDRERANPYAEQADAIAAGHRIFLDHCAHCHGEDANGTKKRPSLRSARVQQEATVGDLHWLLVNGNRGQGMPSWVKLGDPQIWQVITYVTVVAMMTRPIDKFPACGGVVSAFLDEEGWARDCRPCTGRPDGPGQSAQSTDRSIQNDFRHANCAILCKNRSRAVLQELSFQRNCLAVV